MKDNITPISDDLPIHIVEVQIYDELREVIVKYGQDISIAQAIGLLRLLESDMLKGEL